MNSQLKIFLVAFVAFSLFIGSAIFAFDKYYYTDSYVDQDVEFVLEDSSFDNQEEKSAYEKLIAESDRVNILIFGHDGGRSDTIMVASYDFGARILDLISIPRDTYHYVPGHDLQGQNKINAVYGFPGDEGGSIGLLTAIQELLEVPVDYYIKMDYDGVEAVVDALGGIRVDVPFDMKYDDPTAEPPLHIDIKAGTQVLSGAKAMEYLRWRKNNGEVGEGDLPRIERQQEFMALLAEKSLSYKLPTVANTVFQYVKTNMPLDRVLYYATKAVGFDMENLNRYRIPGEVSSNGGSYYIHDPDETQNMIIEIYSQE